LRDVILSEHDHLVAQLPAMVEKYRDPSTRTVMRDLINIIERIMTEAIELRNGLDLLILRNPTETASTLVPVQPMAYCAARLP
jgi:hypothetical protein